MSRGAWGAAVVSVCTEEHVLWNEINTGLKCDSVKKKKN